MALFDLSNSEWLIIAPCCCLEQRGRSMAVLVWMTERCSMASSLSCAPTYPDRTYPDHEVQRSVDRALYRQYDKIARRS